MRINKFIARATGLSRRTADDLINRGEVKVDGQTAKPGHNVGYETKVELGNRTLSLPSQLALLMFNKPIGYVCSRNGQGNKTIYDLLPPEFASLKTVGRLDKNSSGLILLTNDGDLANQLSHPRHRKDKVYQVNLDKQLSAHDLDKITGPGIQLEDGISQFKLSPNKQGAFGLTATLMEGRNRQIRRSFESIGYKVLRLHRINFGNYELGNLPSGKYQILWYNYSLWLSKRSL